MGVIREISVVLTLLYVIGWTSTAVNWTIPHELVRMSPGIYQSNEATSQLTVNPYRGRVTLSVAYDPAVLVKLDYRGKPVRCSPNSIRVGKVSIHSYGDAVEISGPCTVRPYVSRHGSRYAYELIHTSGFSVYFHRTGYLALIDSGKVTKIRVLPLIPLI